MRISGTILDRFVIGILPIAAIVFVFSFFVLGKKNDSITFVLIAMAIIFFSELIAILITKTKPLRIVEGSIYIGKESVTQEQIVEIRRSNALASGKWSIYILTFFLEDGRIVKVLDKPRLFYKDFSSPGKSATAKLLFRQFPELASKFN